MRTGAIGLAIVGALLLATPAMAQTSQIEIFLDHTLRGKPGDVFVVHTESVDPALVGGTCSGTAQTENNASEHPNNDLIISSGESTTVIADFEAIAGMVTGSSANLTLGGTITVSVRLGGNGISSEGLQIAMSCTPPVPETTTSVPAPPETTVATTPPPQAPPATTTTTTTTTTPPKPETRAIQAVVQTPVGGVAAGGGSTAPTGAGQSLLAVGAGLLVLALALGRLAGQRARARQD